MPLSYHLTAVLSSKLKWLDHCYNIVKNAFQKVRPLPKRKRQRLFIKCCITELIKYLFFPWWTFLFCIIMYMFIEDTKLLTLNLEMNSRVRYFWYFSDKEARVKMNFSEKSCLRNERKKHWFFYSLYLDVYIFDTACSTWFDVTIAYHFSLCEKNTFDISIAKITACENIILIKWIKPVISQLKI